MALYRLLWTLLSPGLVLALIWRVLRRRETWADFAQRLGFGGGAGQAQPGAIWLHGASNGELTSARKFIQALAAQHVGTPFLVTANSLSGRDMVAGWGVPGLTARLAPIDLRLCTSSVIRAWRPRILILLENELWPNRIEMVGAPVICVAARMSAKSARMWARLPGLSRLILGRIAYLAPQDPKSAERFTALGLAASALGPVLTLKAGVELPPPDPAELSQLRAHFPADQTWLAASTHEGEEEIVLDAFCRGQGMQKLILAPRHPKRAQDIRKLIDARGLTVAQRSLGEAPKAQVYLADTLGEMAMWYSLAPVTFVGGSFAAIGGHTPYEPTAWGSAVLHGPNVSNFTAIYDDLDAKGAARLVRTVDEFAQAISDLSHTDTRQRAMQSARDVIENAKSNAQSVDQVLQSVAEHL